MAKDADLTETFAQLAAINASVAAKKAANREFVRVNLPVVHELWERLVEAGMSPRLTKLEKYCDQ